MCRIRVWEILPCEWMTKLLLMHPLLNYVTRLANGKRCAKLDVRIFWVFWFHEVGKHTLNCCWLSLTRRHSFHQKQISRHESAKTTLNMKKDPQLILSNSHSVWSHLVHSCLSLSHFLVLTVRQKAKVANAVAMKETGFPLDSSFIRRCTLNWASIVWHGRHCLQFDMYHIWGTRSWTTSSLLSTLHHWT